MRLLISIIIKSYKFLDQRNSIKIIWSIIYLIINEANNILIQEVKDIIIKEIDSIYKIKMNNLQKSMVIKLPSMISLKRMKI